MFISQRLSDALNQEVNLELFAHQQYLAMAHFFDRQSLDGLASFFYTQAEEEKMHALKIVHYLNETGADVTFKEIAAPKQDFASAVEVAQTFLDQETHVTQQFYNMNAMAVEDKDYVTQNFLQWFIAEQLEEMSTANKMLDLFRMAGGNLLMVEMMVGRLSAAQAGGPDAGAEGGA
jgi:ferritin